MQADSSAAQQELARRKTRPGRIHRGSSRPSPSQRTSHRRRRPFAGGVTMLHLGSCPLPVSPLLRNYAVPTARFAAPTTFSARPPTRPSHGPGPALRCPPLLCGKSNPTVQCLVRLAVHHPDCRRPYYVQRTDVWERAVATWPHLVWPEACKTHVGGRGCAMDGGRLDRCDRAVPCH